MKMWVKGVAVAAAGLALLACAPPPMPEPGSSASVDADLTNIKPTNVGRFQGFDLVKFCDGPNAVYVLSAYHSISVSPNDPFCKSPNAYGPGER